jgi:hypothetical protein
MQHPLQLQPISAVSLQVSWAALASLHVKKLVPRRELPSHSLEHDEEIGSPGSGDGSSGLGGGEVGVGGRGGSGGERGGDGIWHCNPSLHAGESEGSGQAKKFVSGPERHGTEPAA